MQNETPDTTASEVRAWAEGAHRNAAGLASSLGVDPERYAEDPLLALPGLQSYVDRLPLGEFQQSDWIGLHTDLTSYLGDLLVRRYGARWVKVEDSNSPAGYRYLVEAKGLDGKIRQVEPYDVAMEEFQNLPIEISRMLANAEAVLHLTTAVDETSLADIPLEELMGDADDSR
ncbi:hypothetical protein RKE30_06210 [Streptomyces sp. Li-HN-5-11]|uniref:hypothetical protein n=1 Tax=Streptomyces sp. Li-HN-5-11 TaxID=3075432 RepID=UPI0028AEB0A0|nr:hypothetical protein [Streptomyces sp. Li-HN-5-11]WNM30023.1 hypothetical protein RKE30_06210 [Streptomyces sp. Li-HN-5-11]